MTQSTPDQQSKNMPTENTPGKHTAIENILVVGPSWVGDMVMSNSLYKELKTVFPGCKITVLGPPWCLPLLDRMQEVDEAINLPFKHGDFSPGRRWAFGKTLRAKNFTRAIVLPNSWKSSLIPLAAGIPIRTGWRGELRYGLLNDCRSLDKKKFPTMVSRFNALAYSSSQTSTTREPAPSLTCSESQKQKALESFKLSEVEYIALCPGAEFGQAKRWPPAHYAKLCQLLMNNNHHIVLLGSPKDGQTAEEILDHLEPSEATQLINLTGKTSLTEVIDLLAGSRAVVTNDSGLMHIAAAFDRPLVALYGPTSPIFTPPLSPSAHLMKQNLSCQPCHQRQCPLKAPNEQHACMKNISPQSVFDLLKTL